MDDIDSDKFDKDLIGKSSKFFQIDLLKAFMIAFVIIDHAFSYTNRWGMGFELWERMAIPMFLIIMGFNMGNTFKNQGYSTLKDLYSWEYFKRKLWRYLFPYIIFYIISTTTAFFLYEQNFTDLFKENWLLEYILFQKTILEGPGNWFIPVLFQSILIIPLLYKLFLKSPIGALIISFLIEISMHLFLFFYIGPRTSIEDILREIPFRELILPYVFAIVLGMWFSRNKNLFSKKNLFVWILFPISVIYMVAWDFFDFKLEIDGNLLVRGDYNFFTFIYSALIFLIILRLIPQNPGNKISRVFTSIGRSTFHIYLLQDLFYAILYIEEISIWQSLYPLPFPGIVNIFGSTASDFLTVAGFMMLNWLICISCGVLWWYSEKRFRQFVQKRKN